MKLTQSKKFVYLYIAMSIFTFALTYGYINGLSWRVGYYLDFNVVKMVYGWFWMTVLFAVIPHRLEKASVFFLHFFFVTQIAPITVVYFTRNDDTLYYSTICIAFLVCEILVRRLSERTFRMPQIENGKLAKYFIGIFAFLVIWFLIQTYRNNGLPTLIAMDIYKVYELRGSDIYQLGKYMSYFQDIIMKIIIPILLVASMARKKYILTILVYMVEVLVYLYAGEKSYLFTGVFVLAIYWWMANKKLADKFWYCFYGGITFVCLLARTGIIESFFLLFVRRCFFVSALNKFYYYDFFLTHPKEGLAGIFPRWLVPIASNYGSGAESYARQIGKIYWNGPNMNANTGFIAEGYLRFGLIGIFVEFILFALILKLIDDFQKKTGYAFAIGTSVLVIFQLRDGHLISPLLCGYITVWFIFLFVFKNKQTPELVNSKKSWKIKRRKLRLKV